jgi:hypothetical protein
MIDKFAVGRHHLTGNDILAGSLARDLKGRDK